MHKSDTIHIILDEPNAVYYPGDDISGKLVRNIVAPARSLAILMELKGSVHIHWHLISESKPLISQKAILRGATEEPIHDPSQMDIRSLTFKPFLLKTGTHYIPFKFTIPKKVFPSSQQSPYVKVKYELEATHLRPLPYYSKKCSIPVSLKEDINVAQDVYITPIVKRETMSLSTWKGWSKVKGEIHWKFTLEHSAYLPGETINVEVELKHFINLNISDGIQLTLWKMGYYKVRDNEKRTSDCVEDATFPLIVAAPSFSTKVIARLTVPTECPPSTKCSFSYWYLLQVVMVVADKSPLQKKMIRHFFPIIIGTLRGQHRVIKHQVLSVSAPVLNRAFLENPPPFQAEEAKVDLQDQTAHGLPGIHGDRVLHTSMILGRPRPYTSNGVFNHEIPEFSYFEDRRRVSSFQEGSIPSAIQASSQTLQTTSDHNVFSKASAPFLDHPPMEPSVPQVGP